MWYIYMTVVKLKGISETEVSARALLDSGSGSNFISAELLPLLDYVKIGVNNLRLAGINSTQEDLCELVKVHLASNECPVKTIKCYVRPGRFSYKVNLKSYKKMVLECEVLPNFVDPLEQIVDHAEGLAMILGPGAIRDISREPPKYFKSYLVDHTYFGPAVSGRMPSDHDLPLYSIGIEHNGVAAMSNLYDLDELRILMQNWNCCKSLSFSVIK